MEKNACPVCGNVVKKDSKLHYCENCGFNINDEEDKPCKAASDGDNMNLKDVEL